MVKSKNYKRLLVNKRVNNKLEQEELARSKLRYEEEKKIEEMKSRYRNTNTDDNSVDAKPNSEVKPRVKLPKLVITKFQETHLDWLRFYETFTTNVQSLDTMGKLNEIKGYVRLTLDKLPCIRADLVRMDDEWQDWDFCNLLQALCKWTERNPISTGVNKIEQKSNIQNMHQQGFRREKLLQTTQTLVHIL